MSLTRGTAQVVDPNLRSGKRPSAKRLEQTDRLVRGTRGIGGTIVRHRPWGLEIGGGSGLDLSKFAFGCSISGATVTVKAGDWPLGESEASMADTPVTISQDHQYVGLEVDPVAKTIQVIGPSTSKSVFLPGGGKFRTWLHQFRFSGSSATLERTHLGSLPMPGYFAQ
jgi:hypothetical protein